MISRIDELKLLSQCALTDNRDAFGRLVEAYQPQVRRFLLNLTMGDEMLTDDLAQETFIKAYLAVRSFKGLSGFGTWLYRIACNEFYNHRRRHTEQRTDDLPEAAVAAPQDAADAAQTVNEAMKRLSDNERAAITLFYIEDLPTKQIAKVMQITDSGVRSLLHRGRTKMAQFIEQDNNKTQIHHS